MIFGWINYRCRCWIHGPSLRLPVLWDMMHRHAGGKHYNGLYTQDEANK